MNPPVLATFGAFLLPLLLALLGPAILATLEHLGLFKAAMTVLEVQESGCWCLFL